MRENIISAADSYRLRLTKLSQRIHDNPELGLEEDKAAEWLCAELRENGFDVEKGVAGMGTAFTAKYAVNQAAPKIGFIAEYDALPEIGHGCGHSLIGPAAVGAALVLKKALPDDLLNIMVFGTPAEENAGGKIPMLRAGLFQGMDAVLMFHAHNEDVAACPMISRVSLVIEFFGKSAHASAFPWNGINALDAIILLFSGINALRQQMRPEARVHGVITEGGTAANIIPEHTRAEFYVRARDAAYLAELTNQVRRCAEAAAIASGCKVKIEEPLPAYLSDLTPSALEQAVEMNMRTLGLNPEKAVPPLGFGSSDFGNVSQEVPAVLSYLKIAPKGVATHSRAFAEASASRKAYDAMLAAVKLMALTAYDLMTQPALLRTINEEFFKLKGGTTVGL